MGQVMAPCRYTTSINAEVEEGNMPPLTTPGTAILLMIGLFTVMTAVPFFFAKYRHH